MKQKDDVKALVESIIQLHETRDFEGLSAYISDTEIKAASWFTKKRFLEVCAAIENEIGTLLSLDYLAVLNRKTSYLTLWKAAYNKSNDEVLWQIIFDTETNKVRLMHINWEHAK